MNPPNARGGPACPYRGTRARQMWAGRNATCDCAALLASPGACRGCGGLGHCWSNSVHRCWSGPRWCGCRRSHLGSKQPRRPQCRESEVLVETSCRETIASVAAVLAKGLLRLGAAPELRPFSTECGTTSRSGHACSTNLQLTTLGKPRCTQAVLPRLAPEFDAVQRYANLLSGCGHIRRNRRRPVAYPKHEHLVFGGSVVHLPVHQPWRYQIHRAIYPQRHTLHPVGSGELQCTFATERQNVNRVSTVVMPGIGTAGFAGCETAPDFAGIHAGFTKDPLLTCAHGQCNTITRRDHPHPVGSNRRGTGRRPALQFERRSGWICVSFSKLGHELSLWPNILLAGGSLVPASVNSVMPSFTAAACRFEYVRTPFPQ